MQRRLGIFWPIGQHQLLRPPLREIVNESLRRVVGIPAARVGAVINQPGQVRKCAVTVVAFVGILLVYTAVHVLLQPMEGIKLPLADGTIPRLRAAAVGLVGIDYHRPSHTASSREDVVLPTTPLPGADTHVNV